MTGWAPNVDKTGLPSFAGENLAKKFLSFVPLKITLNRTVIFLFVSYVGGKHMVINEMTIEFRKIRL